MEKNKIVYKIVLLYEVIYLLSFGTWQLMKLFSIHIKLEELFIVLSIVSIIILVISFLGKGKVKEFNNAGSVVMQVVLTIMIFCICLMEKG